ncbi:MAG: GGDEF domain-containing protein [Bdellovibrionales bacterium]|jgi:diguanylate cyclase (GGDEF)-like protein|nr:GGDEF domain-containing protein [Bdellovibrionales bacterium]MBT3527186.1 GGDEF domain-containing protein [Bdellovibrionales bacterium]MBT7668139.1 GGDEF domain-containing protein [Bdellovibrionales bacterium]MBT7766567.1 GGDEF domain-containing protein [Bdellovibrionales bacterium]
MWHKSLFDFFFQGTSWDSLAVLLEELNQLIHDKDGKLVEIVLSITEQEQSVLWNRRIEHGAQSVPVMEMFRAVYTAYDGSERWMFEKRQDGRSYLVIFLGLINGQQIWAVITGGLKERAGDTQQSDDVELGRYLRTFLLEAIKNEQLLDYSQLIYADEVTGLFNVRKLHEDLDQAVSRYLKSSFPFAVLFIDVDHFKNVNDDHGHLVGTQILNDLGRLLKNNLRRHDSIYRYGGDEFVVLLQGKNIQAAKVAGERLLGIIKGHPFNIIGAKKMHISVSIGIAECSSMSSSKEDVIYLADRMMYQAKYRGRGQVCLASEVHSA